MKPDRRGSVIPEEIEEFTVEAFFTDIDNLEFDHELDQEKFIEKYDPGRPFEAGNALDTMFTHVEIDEFAAKIQAKMHKLKDKLALLLCTHYLRSCDLRKEELEIIKTEREEKSRAKPLLNSPTVPKTITSLGGGNYITWQVRTPTPRTPTASSPPNSPRSPK